jgi:hypothetical protein
VGDHRGADRPLGAGSVNGPTGVGAMSHNPGVASLVANVPAAVSPLPIAARSGSPNPKSNVTGSVACATASTRLV